MSMCVYVAFPFEAGERSGAYLLCLNFAGLLFYLPVSLVPLCLCISAGVQRIPAIMLSYNMRARVQHSVMLIIICGEIYLC